jgi:dTDP-4-dehydrorhamnose reductase
LSRWLVTGAGGQLGRDLVEVLAGRDVVAATRADLDIADPGAVDALLDRAHPQVVLNAAAYTDVDRAESEESVARRVNAVGPAVLAAACARTGAALVHVSTDYVFDGSARRPYPEDAPVCPTGAYGRTKAAGERAVLDSPVHGYVVRTAWVYGAHGSNFVKTMVRLAGARATVDVVDDQRGSPTWSYQLAHGLVSLADRLPPPGIYHATSGGEVSWYGFARAIFEELGADPDRVHPTTTELFPRPAARPAFSALSTRRWRDAGLAELPFWREALADAFSRCRDAFVSSTPPSH